MITGLSAVAVDALTSGHWTFVPRVEWAAPGSRVWQPLDVVSGTLTIDRTQQTRYGLSLVTSRTTTPAGPDGLHPWGCRVRAAIGVKPLRSGVEYLAAGRYSVTQVADVRASGVSVTAASFETDVIASTFLAPRSMPDRKLFTYRQQAEALILEAVPDATFVWSDALNSSAAMPAITVDQDRWGTVSGTQSSGVSIGNALGAEVYCNRNGVFTFRPVPTLMNANPQLSLGWDTYQVARTNTYDRTNVFNVVVCSGQATSGGASIGPVYQWDTNPGSLLYAGPDPVNHPELAGPYGVKPYFFNSSVITSLAQARIAAPALLANVTGLNDVLDITSRFDPRTEVGDVVWADQQDGRRVLALVDKIVYQLGSGAAQVTMRSTNGLSAGNVVTG